MFAPLVQTLSRLMLLRAGPQDLPTWPLLLQGACVLYVFSTIMRLQLVNPWFAALAQSGLGLVTLWIYVRAVLRQRGKPERFAQTLSALLLTGGVIGLLMMPPLQALTPLLLHVAETGDLQGIEPPVMAAYAWLLLSIWGLILAGHIFRHALETTLGIGILIALGYEMLLILVISLLAGMQGA